MAAAKQKPIESVPWDGPAETPTGDQLQASARAAVAEAYAHASTAHDRVRSVEGALRGLAARLEQRARDDRQLAGEIANIIAAAHDTLREAEIATAP